MSHIHNYYSSSNSVKMNDPSGSSSFTFVEHLIESTIDSCSSSVVSISSFPYWRIFSESKYKPMFSRKESLPEASVQVISDKLLDFKEIKLPDPELVLRVSVSIMESCTESCTDPLSTFRGSRPVSVTSCSSLFFLLWMAELAWSDGTCTFCDLQSCG